MTVSDLGRDSEPLDPGDDGAPGAARGAAVLSTPPQLVETGSDLTAIAREAMGAAVVCIDVEASGMHAYRARACTVQLAWNGGTRIVVVDALRTSLEPLAPLLGENGPPKVVHDVAFDARLLADLNLPLSPVFDTAIAARMLARKATGLSALLQSELAVHIPKGMQHHDWRVRPLGGPMLTYLAEDVMHLEALWTVLVRELEALGICEEVAEETRYRVLCANESAREEAARVDAASRAYLRVKHANRLTLRELAALRAVAQVREIEAEAEDVPPHRIASAEALVAIARSRPNTAALVSRIRGVASPPVGAAFAERAARAAFAAGDTIAEEEHRILSPPRLSGADVQALRGRETRLLAWRRAEAKARAVDEQVVLPGHCAKALASQGGETLDDIARVPGLGAFRVARYGPALLRALREEDPPA